MILYFKERRKEMKKKLPLFYIILTVIGLTSIFLLMEREVTAAENAVAGRCGLHTAAAERGHSGRARLRLWPVGLHAAFAHHLT